MDIDSKVQEFNRRLRSQKGHGFEGLPTSWCKDHEIMKDILKAFPEAEVTFVLEKLNDARNMGNAIVGPIPGLGDSNGAYATDFVLTNLFPALKCWMWNPADIARKIPSRTFIDMGQALATWLGRKITFKRGLQVKSINLEMEDQYTFVPKI